MNTTKTRGRYAAPRKSRTPILALLLILGLAAVGCVAGAEADSPGYTSTSADGYDSEPASEPEPLSDEEITRLAIAITFDEASAADMADMCDGVALFGMETAIAFYAEGFGPDWKPSYGPMVEAELRGRC